MIARGVCIDEGVHLAGDVKIWYNSVIRSDVSIGQGSVIGHLVVIERDTIIGRNTTIQSQCHITAFAEIGDNVFFGPGVVMTNEKNIANNQRCSPKIEKTIIGNGVRIGAASVLLPGINIGENAFIGAGSLVAKDVPPGQLWMGRPAKYVRDIPVEEYL